MNNEPFVEAARELRGRFYSLIDSLSALRGLTAIDFDHRPEQELLRGALEILLRHQDLERCSIFLRQGDRLEVLAAPPGDSPLLGQATLVGPVDRDPDFLAAGLVGLVGDPAAIG